MIHIKCSDVFWECRASVWIWKIIPFIMLFLGTFGNIFSVLVLSRRTLRRYSTSVYLLVLAVSDIVTLWSVLLESSLKYGYDVMLINMTSFQCKIAGWVAFSFGTVSTWTITNMTVERVIMTKFPVWAKVHIKPKVALITSMITFFLVQCATVHLLYGFKLITHTNPGRSNTTTVAVYMCNMVTPEYEQFFFTTWNLVVLLAFNLAPVCIIITGNCVIAISLLSKRRRLIPQTPFINQVARRDMAITKTLFAISFYFIVCTTPICIFLVLTDSESDNPNSHAAAIDRLVLTVFYMLLFTNFTFNFYLYVCRATIFRKEYKQIIQAWKNMFTRFGGTCRFNANVIMPLQPGTTTRVSTINTQTTEQM